MYILSQFDEAWDIFVEMRSLKVGPDLFTYNILINACANKQSVPTARELMDIMRKDEIAPDLVTYNSLIKVCSFTLFLYFSDVMVTVKQCGKTPVSTHLHARF